MPAVAAAAKKPRRWLRHVGLLGVGLGALQAPWIGSAFFLPGRKEQVVQEAPPPAGDNALVVFLLLAAVAGCIYELRRRIMLGRQLQRPYSIKNPSGGDIIQDPYRFLTQIINFLQEEIVKPLDEQLPGRPFEYDLHSFPFIPMVLVIGNHSSGKSTFINRLVGLHIQETGVAPTDDGFTVLERHATIDEMEDGPTLLGCRENRPFRELQRFGQSFTGRFRRKRVTVSEEECYLPEGLQIVDTPGMIDMPGNSAMVGGRGYNFIEVVRWFAKRADLILLLFDPDKPGTTGEALDVLTKSLAGLDHKFLIVLNKVDTLDNSVDFARAYGTLGWALSKVIPRKDIPTIYTMYNSGFGAGRGSQALDKKEMAKEVEHKLPLEAFMAKREEVISEVLRAKVRHWDNVVTSFEETLRQLEMVLTISRALHIKVLKRRIVVWSTGVSIMIALPIFVTLLVMYARWSPRVPDEPESPLSKILAALLGPTEVVPDKRWWVAPWPYELVRWEVLLGIALLYVITSVGVAFLLTELCGQFERLQVASLDDYFEDSYARYFIHTDGEDHKWRWASVKIKIRSMALCGTVARLPQTPRWKIDQIRECIEKDCWYLRQLAKLLRGNEPGSINVGASGKRRKSDGPRSRQPYGVERGA